MISAVVLARNEEKNINECLQSLKFCDELIVIDDNSYDKTREIAESCGAKVINHPLNRDFAAQRNFAQRQADNEWILFIDADERVGNELKDEILFSINSNNSANGFYFRRIDFFMGKWLKYGEIGSTRILRLARKGSGEWKRKVDEVWEVKGKTEVFENPLLHYSHPTLLEFLSSINERSTINAEEFFNQGKKLSFWEWLKPIVKFKLNYFLRLGFLEGTAGFVFAVLMSLHSFMVRGKLYLLWKKKET